MRHAEDLEQAKQFASDFLDKTRARFNGGTVAKVDVLKAQVDLAQAQNELIANQRDTASARATLNRLLGRPGGAPSPPPTHSLRLRSCPLSRRSSNLPRVATGTANNHRAARRAPRPRPSRPSVLAAGLQPERRPERGAGRAGDLHHRSRDRLPDLLLAAPEGEIASANHREQELAANLVDQSAR